MHDNRDFKDAAIRPGVVTGVEADHIIVRMDNPGDDCGGCHTCAMKNLCGGRDIDHLDVRVPVSGDARPEVGTSVNVAYRPANAAAAAIVMFLPALIGLFAGGFAGYRLSGGSDTLLLVGCAAGLAAGVGVSIAASRLAPALKPFVRLAEDV